MLSFIDSLSLARTEQNRTEQNISGDDDLEEITSASWLFAIALFCFPLVLNNELH